MLRYDFLSGHVFLLDTNLGKVTIIKILALTFKNIIITIIQHNCILSLTIFIFKNILKLKNIYCRTTLSLHVHFYILKLQRGIFFLTLLLNDIIHYTDIIKWWHLILLWQVLKNKGTFALCLHHLILLTNKPQHNTTALLSAFLMTTLETKLNENNVQFQNCSQELWKAKRTEKKETFVN